MQRKDATFLNGQTIMLGLSEKVTVWLYHLFRLETFPSACQEAQQLVTTVKNNLEKKPLKHHTKLQAPFDDHFQRCKDTEIMLMSGYATPSMSTVKASGHQPHRESVGGAVMWPDQIKEIPWTNGWGIDWRGPYTWKWCSWLTSCCLQSDQISAQLYIL